MCGSSSVFSYKNMLSMCLCYCHTELCTTNGTVASFFYDIIEDFKRIMVPFICCLSPIRLSFPNLIIMSKTPRRRTLTTEPTLI